MQGQANLEPLAKQPEALNLIQAMLKPQPKQRPNIAAVMAHPFWWPASTKLGFLVDLSNRFENEDREVILLAKHLVRSVATLPTLWFSSMSSAGTMLDFRFCP